MQFWYSDYAHNKILTAGGASVVLQDRHPDFAKILDSGLIKPRFRGSVVHTLRKLLSPHKLFRSCYEHRLSTKTAFESLQKNIRTRRTKIIHFKP